jgi:hypothetical protein
LFIVASDYTMTALLLHKNQQGRVLHATDLAYASMIKQAYALVKEFKYFLGYFWNARIVAYIPHPMVKDILLQ